MSISSVSMVRHPFAAGDLVVKSYGKTVSDDIVREFLPLELALYSVWMPGDFPTAAIQSTRLDPVCTFDEIIERDDVHAACAAYLLRSGAPVFRDANARRAYTGALEKHLRQGLAPAAARDAALKDSDLSSIVRV